MTKNFLYAQIKNRQKFTKSLANSLSCGKILLLKRKFMRKIDLERRHGNIMKNSFDLSLINKEAKDNLTELIETSEYLYRSQVRHIVKELVEYKTRIVLLAGPSSAGKTTTSHLIRESLKAQGIDSFVVSLDDFFKNREDTPRLPDGKYDFESINAIDLEYLNKFVDDLLDKREAKMPVFDFLTGRRKPELIDVKLNDHTLVIFEGIHALNPTLIQNHDEDIYKIYICINSNFFIGKQIIIPAKRLRQMRRLIRDYYHRGHSLSKTFELWGNVVRGEDMFIKPFKTTANYILDSTHMYEPLIYASYLAPLLKDMQEEEAKELCLMLEKCGKLKKDVIPKDSLLNEFIE